MKVPKWSSMLFSDVSWTKPSSYLEAPINPPYIFLQDEAPEMAKLPHKFVSELAFWWIKKNIHGLHVFATNMAWFQTVFHVFFFFLFRSKNGFVSQFSVTQNHRVIIF